MAVDDDDSLVFATDRELRLVLAKMGRPVLSPLPGQDRRRRIQQAWVAVHDRHATVRPKLSAIESAGSSEQMMGTRVSVEKSLSM